MQLPSRKLFVAVMATAATVGTIPAAAAQAAGAVTATFEVISSWSAGHVAKVTLKNGTSTNFSSWKMDLALPSSNVITNYWNVNLSKSGSHYIAVQKESGGFPSGATRTWSYMTEGSFAKPTYCTANSYYCFANNQQSPGPSVATVTPKAATSSKSPSPVVGASNRKIAYFPSYVIYNRNYHVKNLETSGAASRLSQIIYGFGKVVNGQCAFNDTYADYGRYYSATASVNGVADSYDSTTVRGNIGQLRRLKAMHPGLKVTWTIGGWDQSTGFPLAAANPAAFADSCYRMVKDPRWADVFDGIDIDWEFPNGCGIICDTSGPNAFKNLMSALRVRFGTSAIITAAITADGRPGKMMDTSDYAGAAQYVNWLLPMSYGYSGTWAKTGPTALHAALYSYTGLPYPGYYADTAVQRLKSLGIPASKIMLGVDFFGRGWTGVTQTAPGGSVTGLASSPLSPGVDTYNSLRTRCPSTATLAGTAYAKCGSDWWSYDTPATMITKMQYVRSQGLAGAFVWEISADTPNADLMRAIAAGLA